MEARLLAWHASHAPDLPWRRRRDAYAVLVSEMMLQQTQASRVAPRFEAWLRRWPTVESLAGATGADVIVEWQGLGYNRRAVQLHRAARVVAEHGWPADLTELPGVGAYTSAAIRRFAWGEDVLPADTNVKRVAARTQFSFSARAAEALMDLGRGVCLARVPRCDACPLAPDCPSRGRRYEPLRKQSRFEGSFRERRARTLRLVAARAQRLSAVDREAVESLAADGLVRLDRGFVRLPT
ncbi:MAG: A/G-specific adenine glycosylase [Actinomycetota bacterium]|nr:A/G-specific adenine glycosylase [Actinomycetota bacterium]